MNSSTSATQTAFYLLALMSTIFLTQFTIAQISPSVAPIIAIGGGMLNVFRFIALLILLAHEQLGSLLFLIAVLAILFFGLSMGGVNLIIMAIDTILVCLLYSNKSNRDFVQTIFYKR